MNLAKYTFFSWVRQGLGRYIQAPGSIRASVQVDVDVHRNGSSISTVSKDIDLIGPVDILGLDPQNIIRMHPEPNTGNFEPNYLAFIEFYQDSFLWDYTPEQANGEQLNPWLFLLVLEESEYTFTESSKGLNKIKLDSTDPLPNPDDLFAWAHLHVNADSADVNDLEGKIKNNPDFAITRLLSPRRLQPNKFYEAFVIPAYESGRQSGLGMDTITVSSADDLSLGETEFPVYHSWKFQTGAKGDFESLVKELVPRESDKLHPSIGYREMDTSEANKPYENHFSINLPNKFSIGGALRPVDSTSPVFNHPDWQIELANLVNQREQQQSSAHDANTDPVIVPPTYGHWHVLVEKLNDGGNPQPNQVDDSESKWLHTLNLNPAHRVTAGLGTKIIQENQDHYLEIAWSQIGSVLEANQLLRQSQLGVEIAVRWWDKHIKTQSDSEILAFWGPVLSSVLCNGNVQSIIANSALPTALIDPAFKRIGNSRSRIAKKYKTNKEDSSVPDKSFVELFSIGLDKDIAPDGRVVTGGKNREKFEPDAKDFITGFTPNTYPGFPSKIPRFPKILLPDPNVSVYDYERMINDPDYHGPNPVEQIPIDKSVLIETWNNFIAATNNYSGISASLPPALDLTAIMPCVKNKVHPSVTIKNRTLNKIGLKGDLDAIIPIMAAPDYPEPMYKKLLGESADFILPNLDKLPNNTITLMQANQEFIEAYMVGLNFEMASELLWGEYPTDQRGSYFRQFWDVSRFVDFSGLSESDLAEKLKDIDFIHRWIKWSDLGDHNMGNRGPLDPPKTTEPLVLTIRGDLLNRYPDTAVFAIKADQNREFDPKITDKKYPVFSAKIEPDITFLGFELSPAEVNGDLNDSTKPGWFFCLKEPPEGPRFGMDVEKQDSSFDDQNGNPSWSELHWGHMKDLNNIQINNNFDNAIPDQTWGTSSANMANILYQQPVMVAIHGSQMM